MNGALPHGDYAVSVEVNKDHGMINRYEIPAVRTAESRNRCT